MMMKAMLMLLLRVVIRLLLKGCMLSVNHHIHLSMMIVLIKLLYAYAIFSLFRFIDHETMSMQSTVSLGRVGRVLGGEIKLASRSGSRENISRATTPEVKTPSSIETPLTPVPSPVVNCQEPDVVASAKASIQTDIPPVVTVVNTEDEATQPLFEPVAPPRRRRNKAKAPSPPVEMYTASSLLGATSDTTSTAITSIPTSLSAPSFSMPVIQPSVVVEPYKKGIGSLTKGFEFSLDLMSATKGNYVIKPQV